MIQESHDGKYGTTHELYEPPSTRSRKTSAAFLRFGGACIAIMASVVSWIIMAEKLQRVNKEYQKPFFITYWVHSCYSILYVLWKAWSLFPGGLSCNRVGEGAWKGSSRQLLILSGFLAVISFVSAYLWFYSLARTNIPANTAIYQSVCVWVFLLSIVLLRERVTVLKISAVAISVVGVCLVAVYSNNCGNSSSSNSTEWTVINSTTPHSAGGGGGGGGHLLGHVHRGTCNTEHSTPMGYVALILSISTYALFEVGYKKWGSKKEDSAAVLNSARFLGYLGVNTLFWFWPFFFVVHFSGLERFEWPPLDIFILLVWNALLNIMFYVGLLVCIALSSALFASIGTILVVPTAVLVDWIFQGFLLSPLAAVGVVLIVCGFTGFVVSEVITVRLEAKTKGGDLKPTDKDDNVWEEKQPHDLEDERALLLRNRRKKLRATILKYLF